MPDYHARRREVNKADTPDRRHASRICMWEEATTAMDIKMPKAAVQGAGGLKATASAAEVHHIGARDPALAFSFALNRQGDRLCCRCLREPPL